MIEKWYRGHQGDKKATENFGIIWLSDNPDYAHYMLTNILTV